MRAYSFFKLTCTDSAFYKFLVLFSLCPQIACLFQVIQSLLLQGLIVPIDHFSATSGNLRKLDSRIIAHGWWKPHLETLHLAKFWSDANPLFGILINPYNASSSPSNNNSSVAASPPQLYITCVSYWHSNSFDFLLSSLVNSPTRTPYLLFLRKLILWSTTATTKRNPEMMIWLYWRPTLGVRFAS